MKQDLLSLHTHLEDELKQEKQLSAEDKAKKDENFIAIIEIARSLLPDEMIPDINFPVTGLLGLSHPETITQCKITMMHTGLPKLHNSLKKRDTTFYLNEIFGILDQLYSEKL